MRDLQVKQVEGGEIETIEANKAPGVKIPAHEKHLVHATLETKQFNQTTGAKTSVPVQQTFYPADFDRMEKANAFKGKSVTILHDPSAESEAAARAKVVAENNSEGTGKAAETAKSKNKGKAAETAKEPAKKTPAELAKAYTEAAAKYKELYNEEPASDATLEDLQEAIESKLAEQEQQ